MKIINFVYETSEFIIRNVCVNNKVFRRYISKFKLEVPYVNQMQNVRSIAHSNIFCTKLYALLHN